MEVNRSETLPALEQDDKKQASGDRSRTLDVSTARMKRRAPACATHYGA